VLNIESYVPRAYFEGHCEFLKQQADAIAALCLEVNDRDSHIEALNLIKTRTLGPLTRKDLARYVLEKLSGIFPGAADLRGILYTPCYFQGNIQGFVYDRDPPVPICHKFLGNEPSFARDVLHGKRWLYFDDIQEAIRQGRVNRDTADEVGLRTGPIFGTQVFDRELPVAVLVLWETQGETNKAHGRCQLQRGTRQALIATYANLVVSGRELAHERLNDNNDIAEHILAIQSASEPDIFNCMGRAVEALGLRRLRVWRCSWQAKNATIVYSWPASHTVLGATESWDRKQADYSEYSQFVVNRYQTDPWARTQGLQMFNLGPDPRHIELQKPKQAEWIVVPVFDWENRERPIWGYLAVDNVPEELQNQPEADYEEIHFHDWTKRNWLQCGMSVIAVALAEALRTFPNLGGEPKAGRPTARWSRKSVRTVA
jgi:hypothetical protein